MYQLISSSLKVRNADNVKFMAKNCNTYLYENKPSKRAFLIEVDEVIGGAR